MGSGDPATAHRGRRRGSGGSFVASFVGQGIGGAAKVLSTVAVARVLGPEAFGRYSLAVALSLGIFTLAGLSATSGGTYAVARSEARDDRAWSVLCLGWVLAIGICALGSLLVQGVRLLFPGSLDAGLVSVAVLASGIYLVVNMAASVVLGTGRYRSFNLLSAGYYVVSGIGSLVGAAVIGTAMGAVSAWLLTTLIWAVASSAYVWTLSSSRHLGGFVQEWRPVMRFGLPSHVSNVITFANYRFDLLLVGLLVGATGAGEYAAVVGVAEILWFMSISASTVLFNEVAGRDDTAAARALSERVARLVLWTTVSASMMVGVFAAQVIGLLYGAEYESSAASLRVLLVGVVALSLSRVLANHVAASGAPGRNIVGSVLALCLSLGLDLVLIPRWGVLGAAMSSSVAYSAALCHRLYVFDRTRPQGTRGGLGYLRVRASDLSLLREVLSSLRS